MLAGGNREGVRAPLTCIRGTLHARSNPHHRKRCRSGASSWDCCALHAGVEMKMALAFVLKPQTDHKHVLRIITLSPLISHSLTSSLPSGLFLLPPLFILAVARISTSWEWRYYQPLCVLVPNWPRNIANTAWELPKKGFCAGGVVGGRPEGPVYDVDVLLARLGVNMRGGCWKILSLSIIFFWSSPYSRKMCKKWLSRFNVFSYQLVWLFPTRAIF